MSDIYRVPAWLMLEYWEMQYNPTDKPNVFTVTIFTPNNSPTGGNLACSGKGVSISHASKNAFKNRLTKLKNDTSIPTEGSALPSENQASEEQPQETS